MDANNNLDIVRHEGRLFLAFRSAPTHFASDEVVMYVVSSSDEESWRYEGAFALGTDVREPQLVSWDGRLILYFGVLGTNPAAFEPQGARFTTYNAPGDWEPLQTYPDDTFIPWRIKVVDGDLQMVGYTGGGAVYEPGGEHPIDIHWLHSGDGEVWTPVVDDGVVHTGGGSEADYVLLDDGSLVAVIRNEAGDESGFGSKICRADSADLGIWECVTDPRKFDSPLLFRHGEAIWLVARRNLTEDGHYDLGLTDLDHQAQYLAYQGSYWISPKRCALWSVDTGSLSVSWALDLPSRGDTCFPEAVEHNEGWVLYNYTSDPNGPDVSWVEGQNAPTFIYRHVLEL